MHTLSQQVKAKQGPATTQSTLRPKAHFERRDESAQPQLTKHVEANATTEKHRFAHDFSQVPVHAAIPTAVQPSFATNKPVHSPMPTTGGTTAESASEQSFSPAPSGFDFSLRPIYPSPSSIPILGRADDEIYTIPLKSGLGPAPSTTGTTTPASCDVPTDMQKVTSGSFKGGLTINSYYPDLASLGLPAHAGPYDLGNRAGSSVQLLGVIPSPCQPSRFSLAQLYHFRRIRVNGAKHPLEGKAGDDIAKSGRNASRPPFRQEFMGGGTAPLGYIISMADTPSITYNKSIKSIEYDLFLETSLVGHAARRSVTWAISVRINNGKVTKNTVT